MTKVLSFQTQDEPSLGSRSSPPTPSFPYFLTLRQLTGASILWLYFRPLGRALARERTQELKWEGELPQNVM